MKHFTRWIIFIGVIGVVFVCPANAQDISFAAEVDRTNVALDGAIELLLTVEGTQNVSPLHLPDIDGFEAEYRGPSKNISIVNGEVTSSISFRYVLFPQREGVFTIPSFQLNLDGEEYRSDPISITVAEKTGTAQKGQADDPSSSARLDEKIFLVLQPAKTESYINERIPVKVMLFVQDLQVELTEYPEIDSPGFTIRDFEQGRRYSQIIQGKQYEIQEFNTVAYPTRTGNLDLGPATLNCNIRVRTQTSGRFGNLFDDDFFDGFFDRMERRGVALRSEEETVQVLSLPEEGRPEDFSNAVGQFQFDVEIGPDKLKEGDPITVKMEIAGNGNLDAVDFPTLEGLENFKTYEPNITKENGRKILEQVVIPTSHTVAEFPRIEFSYFDPDAKIYRSIKKGPFPLDVAESTGQGPTFVGIPQKQLKQTPETVGEDIVFIQGRPGRLIYGDRFFYETAAFPVLTVLILAGWAGGFWYYRRTHRLETDIVYAQRKRAPKEAKRNIHEARRQLKEGNREEFYDTVFRTLQEYFGKKLQVPAGDVSFETLKPRLQEVNVDENDIASLQGLFGQCEQARYAATSKDLPEATRALTELERVIQACERRIK